MSKPMICTNCFRMTSEDEANQRKYNNGKCGHCGGDLKEHKHPKKRTDLVPAHPPAKRSTGELDNILKGRPELAADLALGKRLILNTSINLGDYVSFIVMGVEDMTPEIVIDKEELRRFAEEVLEKVKA